MSYPKLKEKATEFITGIDDLLVDASQVTLRGTNMLVFPIPAVPKNLSIEIPGEFGMDAMPRYFTQSPNRAILLQSSPMLKANGDIYGQYSIQIGDDKIWSNGSIMITKFGRLKEAVLFGGQVCYLIDITDIACCYDKISLADVKKELEELLINLNA